MLGYLFAAQSALFSLTLFICKQAAYILKFICKHFNQVHSTLVTVIVVGYLPSCCSFFSNPGSLTSRNQSNIPFSYVVPEVRKTDFFSFQNLSKSHYSKAQVFNSTVFSMSRREGVTNSICNWNKYPSKVKVYYTLSSIYILWTLLSNSAVCPSILVLNITNEHEDFEDVQLSFEKELGRSNHCTFSMCFPGTNIFWTS